MTIQKYTIDYLKDYCNTNNILYDTLLFNEWKGRDTIIVGTCITPSCSNSYSIW